MWDIIPWIAVAILIIGMMMENTRVSHWRSRYMIKEKQMMKHRDDTVTYPTAPSAPFRYIGFVTHTIREEVSRDSRTLRIKTLFYMTPDGERAVAHATPEPHLRQWLDKNETQIAAWLLGDKFPDDFVSCTEDEGLAEMLSNLIDKKITGEQS